MNKILCVLLLFALFRADCGRDPDAVIEGCCTDSYINFCAENGDPTMTPRYRLVVDGQDYLVDGITYVWAQAIIPRRIKLEYWLEDDGGWTLGATQIGDCY